MQANVTMAKYSHMTPASVERVRVRSRLLARGVTVRMVAEEARRDEGFVSRVLARQRSCVTEAGREVVRAAERLSGLTWGELVAPTTRRRAA
jgi:hypothetical protein